MKSFYKFLLVFAFLVLSGFACSLPTINSVSDSGQPETASTVIIVVQTETALSSEEVGETEVTPTNSGTPTESPTVTYTPSPTLTPIIPTSTNTLEPSPTPTNTPFIVFPVFPLGTGTISGFVFFDLNFNGVFNPEVGETPAQSGTARIMEGACPGGDIFFQAATAANGTFSKSDVPLGTYCVLVVPNGIKWGGNYVPTFPNPAHRTVEVTLNKTVSAGFFGFRKD